MKQQTEMGKNRTGMGNNPAESKRMLETLQEGGTSNPKDAHELNKLRAPYLERGEPVGSIPVPPAFKGPAAAYFEKGKGKDPAIFVDRLGERLAFERTGARLYDTVIGKLQGHGGAQTENILPKLREFRTEEIRHFDLVWRALEAMGCDPTVLTPTADLAGVEASGLLKVASDPRSTPYQYLHALLVAEMADHDGWNVLAGLAEQIGDRDLAERFRKALGEEEQHLEYVRGMLTGMLRKAVA